MPKKLNNEEVDLRLKGRGIIRINNYEASNRKLEFCCEKCKKNWLATPSSVLVNLTGCPHCSGNFKKTNEDIDQALLKRNIIRVGEYQNTHTSIEFLCKTCNKTWFGSPKNIIHYGTGCLYCSRHVKKTNEMVDQELIGRGIIRMDDYKNANSKIEFKCEKCLQIWVAKPAFVLNSKTGCPFCAGKIKKTNKKVDQDLLGRNIKRIDDYIDSDTQIKFECEICGKTWNATPYSILNRKTGCPHCAGYLKKTDEYLDSVLINRNIIRMGSYVNMLSRIEFKCGKCQKTWFTNPNSILNNKTGCPFCAILALNLTEEEINKRLLGRNILKLDPYVNGNTKINFKCEKCGNIWKATPNSVLGSHQTGCPDCASGKNEKLAYQTLLRYFPHFEKRKYIKHLAYSRYRIVVDFYLPKFRVFVEYNGIQHYQPVRFGGLSAEEAEDKFVQQQVRDRYLEQWCINNEFNLIWIDGRHYKGQKLIEYIERDIVPMINNIILFFNEK